MSGAREVARAWPRVVVVLSVVACTDRRVETTAQAPTTTSGATTDDAPTTGGLAMTGDPPGASTGGSTGDAGPSLVCRSACAETWAYDGDLSLWAGSEPADFTCMTVVHGALQIDEGADPAVVATLRDLVRVDLQFSLRGDGVFADPSVFACMREVGGLLLEDMPSITDIAPLSRLVEVVGIQLRNTGLAALPSFSQEFTGVNYVTLSGNAALSDVSAMGGWGAYNDALGIEIEGSPLLSDITGVAGLIAELPEQTAVRLNDLPALASLAGLEPLRRGGLHLSRLPLVSDLEPLSQLQAVSSYMRLVDMPQLTSFAGLASLKSAGYLSIGDCSQPTEPGLVGLTDLSGLDALVELEGLHISNSPTLSSLGGAPQLTALTTELRLIETPGLSQAAVDAFLAELAVPPAKVCEGDWNTCGCL